MDEARPFRVLCLDLGTTAGWAFSDGVVEESGVWRFDGAHAVRLHHFSLRLSKAVREMQPSLIAYEEIFFGKNDSIAAQRLLNQMMGFVDVTALRAELATPRRVNPLDIKRTTCGIMVFDGQTRRRAVKEDVRKVVQARRARPIRDHNEADALAIMDLLLAEHRAGHRHQPVPRNTMIAKALAKTKAVAARRRKRAG
jgi:Holliday junction resolvasome RuvABC endonuclease subunit